VRRCEKHFSQIRLATGMGEAHGLPREGSQTEAESGN